MLRRSTTIVYRTDRQALSTARFCRTGLLATADTWFRTCRRPTSSLCTIAWQPARFQLTRRIARSLGDSWAFCSCYLSQQWPREPGRPRRQCHASTMNGSDRTDAIVRVSVRSRTVDCVKTKDGRPTVLLWPGRFLARHHEEAIDVKTFLRFLTFFYFPNVFYF